MGDRTLERVGVLWGIVAAAVALMAASAIPTIRHCVVRDTRRFPPSRPRDHRDLMRQYPDRRFTRMPKSDQKVSESLQHSRFLIPVTKL